MRRSIGARGYALGVVLVCATLGARGADVAEEHAGVPCAACLDLCAAPLSNDDSLLDESTDYYLPSAAREIATAAAIEMATKLKGIFDEYRAGEFGRVYASHAAAIESLAARHPQDHATSAEIDSLKRVRTALYADTAVRLRADAMDPRAREIAATYQARAALLEDVIRSVSARQQMRKAGRLAVCEVLAAYRQRVAGSVTPGAAGTGRCLGEFPPSVRVQSSARRAKGIRLPQSIDRS